MEPTSAAFALDIAIKFGLPTAILVVVLVYHAKVVKAKDVELARINEMRVTESKDLADRLLGRDKAFLELIREVDKTLTIMLERERE